MGVEVEVQGDTLEDDDEDDKDDGIVDIVEEEVLKV